MKGISSAVATWLIEHEAIYESDRELYEYATYSLIMLIAPLGLSMIIGSLMGELRMSIILVIPFMCIRKYSGGFHTKNPWTCLVISGLLLWASLYMAKEIENFILLNNTVLLAAIGLVYFSPIDSENRRLQKEEQSEYKRNARRIVLIFLLVYILLQCIGAEDYAIYIAMGLILSAVLQAPCILQKIKYWI